MTRIRAGLAWSLLTLGEAAALVIVFDHRYAILDWLWFW